MSAFSAPPLNPNLDSSNLEQLKDGTRVTLVGLQTESMIGLTGTSLHLAGDGERYIVRLDADGKSMKIKPDNLVINILEQLKSEAIAFESSTKHEEALAKYEEVLVVQQRDLPVGHPDTHETLTSIDRVIDQLKYASIDNGDVSESAHSLFVDGKGDDAYRLLEQTYQRLLVTYGADHPDTLRTRHNMAFSLYSQNRYVEALSMFEPLLKKQTCILPLDHHDTLKTTVGAANVLTHLKRYDEALKMYEDVAPKLIRVLGENHDLTLDAMVRMANTQFHLRRFDDAKQTATRGLLIARRTGNEERATPFVDTLSELEKREEDKIFAATASDEQKVLRDKINQRKWAKEKAAAHEAALLATRAKATTEDDLDALMAQFGFEEGDDCSGGKGEKKKSGRGTKKKKKKKKGK
jgi:tetratricopeptide (TPR) repeat protein